MRKEYRVSALRAEGTLVRVELQGGAVDTDSETAISGLGGDVIAFAVPEADAPPLKELYYLTLSRRVVMPDVVRGENR